MNANGETENSLWSVSLSANWTHEFAQRSKDVFLTSCGSLKCVPDTAISNWFENHQPRKKKFPPSCTLLSFKPRIKWPLGWLQPQVLRGYFFNSCNFQGNFQAFRLTVLLWWQKLTWIFQHFLQDFKISQFNSAFAVHEERCSRSGLKVAWFPSTHHNSLLRTVTNQIASFCIDNRLRQMDFSSSPKWAKAGQRPAFALRWNILN